MINIVWKMYKVIPNMFISNVIEEEF